MSGKRKMNEMSGGSQEKLSKKAKLKLARERAAQFAQRDKARVTSQKGKRSGTVLTKPKIQSSPQKSEVQKKVKSPNEKTPLAEQRKIAKENAKQFAARDRAEMHFKKRIAGASPRHQQKESSSSPMELDQQKKLQSNAVSVYQLPESLPNQQNFGVAIDPTQVAAYERTRQIASVQNETSATSQRIINVPSEFLLGGGIGDTTVSSGGHGNNDNFAEEMNDGDIPPPPPVLMAQVSQQVLLNAGNQDEDSVNPVAAEDEKQSEGKDDQEIITGGSTCEVSHLQRIDGNDQHIEAQRVKTRWLPKITSVVVVVVAISSIILMLPMPSNELPKLTSGDDAEVPQEPICYYNSGTDGEEYCSNGSECPKGGICEGGELVVCHNRFQDISDRADKCVLGKNYLPIKDALINELVNHASQTCDHSVKPSYKYATLQKNNATIPEEASEDIIEALNDEGFVIHYRDDFYVGLPEGFAIYLPMYCHVGRMGHMIVQEIGFLLLGILRFVLTNLLGFASSYPGLFVSNLFGFVCFILYRRHRAAKRKRQQDTMRTRELAYRTLEESCGLEHYAIHIRDEIAMELYPNSKKDRLELQMRIWPKIVDDVKRDTRIRKFQTFNRDGKARDMWQWAAVIKTPGKL